MSNADRHRLIAQAVRESGSAALMVPGGRPRAAEGALTARSHSPPWQRCASTPRSSAAAA